MFVCTECGASAPAPGHCPADGTPLHPIGEDLLLGQTIGAYRVARLLGVGGMGRVYKGVHPTIGSRVAIKVLSRECSDRRDLVDRFFSEARAVNVIRHESIVNVLDLAMLSDGRPYIIMEYLDGAPLAGIVEVSVHRQQPLPLGGLARLCAEVLDALGAAHAKGVVHRDLKPDNIFVTPSGRPKVLDFGIAKLTDLKGSATATGSLLGTPHYMAPEQAAGRPVDHRADVYAMGIILFECATGAKPFVADSLFDLLRKHVEAPPPMPRSLRPDMPPELEQVILCALAKAPDQRFASAQAMSLALQHATQNLPQDQWAPILGGPEMANTLPQRAWAPSQPQSWSGRSGPSQPPPPQQPHAAPQQPMAHQTTVSASSGQLARHPRPGGSSKKGLVLGLAFLAVAIGGIAVAVTMSGSGDASDGSATTAAVAPAGSGDDSGEGSAIAATPPVKPPVDPADPDDGDEAADDVGQTVNEALDEAVKEMEGLGMAAGQLEAHKKQIAEAKSRLEKAGIKVNVAEPKGDAKAEAVDDDAEAPPGKTGWFTRHDVSPPSRNWKKLDAEKHIDWAIAYAKKHVPDAQLTRIDISWVASDGTANLSIPDGAHPATIDVRFISPSRAKRDPSIPRGAPSQRVCEFRILAGPGGSEMYEMFATDCKTVAVPRPKCSLAKVWKKALAKKPDLADAVASVTYTSNIVSKRIVWMFGIEDDGERLMSEQFSDDC